jgi:tol-pal system protein YbgF
MTFSRLIVRTAASAACCVVLAGGAMAQSSGGLFGGLFDSNQSGAEHNEAQAASDLQVQVDQLRSQLRQATGQIEQLQYQNRQLQDQLSRYQGGQPGAAATPGMQASAPMQRAPAQGAPMQGTPMQAPGAQTQAALPAPQPEVRDDGRRGDAFNPALHPNAPGVPRALGGTAAVVPQSNGPAAYPAAPYPAGSGAPVAGGPGAPLDLSSLSGNPQQPAPARVNNAPPPPANGNLPAPPPSNTSATGPQLATLPPSNSPKDEFELARGYILRKDYGLAENAFRDFLRRHPNDKLTPDANYWLGESLFQRKRYQDAADSYLVVVRNYEHADKAPDAMLRLGESLARLGQKEMACASLNEVNRKYPRASASVKRDVKAEQKRAHC